MQLDQLKRREFVTLLGGAAAWPLASSAQQLGTPVIGLLNGQSPETYSSSGVRVAREPAEKDFVEGQNVAIEYRWAEGHDERLPALAADLVSRRVAVLVAGGSVASAIAAKEAVLNYQTAVPERCL
jgi:putative tryptophan/tyrosine transport system substrate-binding protein